MLYRFNAALLMMIFLVATIGCSSGTKQAVSPRMEISNLQLQQISLQKTGGYEVAGTVKAAQSTIMSAQANGRVSSVQVREGAVVQVGQVLVTLSAPDTAQRTRGAEQQVAAATAARQLAEATHARMLTLFDGNAVSRQELDRAIAAKDGAIAEESRARAAALESAAVEGYLEIRAPYTGVVIRQLAEVGMMVLPAQPLVTIEDQTRYEIETWIDVAQSGQVAQGMQVELKRAGNEQGFQAGIVTNVASGAVPESRSFLVKITPAEGQWRSGEYVQVRLPLNVKERLTVPQEAIVRRGQLTGVYVVGTDNVISYRLIRTGNTEGNKTEVVAGLIGQERIVIGGAERAVDGALFKGGTQ